VSQPPLRFEHMRVQMLFPCAARCQWCRTFLKNPEFGRLYRQGEADAVHAFYLAAMERYRPRALYISGGEALLMPGIADFLRQALDRCDHVHVYTSYQYPAHVLQNPEWADLPADRVTLAHSCIHFLPDRWHNLTNGFPHARYVANLRAAKALPFRKTVKFVLNHPESDEEVRAFLDAVEPDDRFALCYKLLNDQNNGFGAPRMRATRDRVRALLRAGERGESPLPLLNPGLAGAVAADDLLARCPYRHGPKEVRFAFYRARPEGVCLKVRFCPYFGPDTSHKFTVGATPLEKIDRWFRSGEYRGKCDTCRLRHYSDATGEDAPSGFRLALPILPGERKDERHTSHAYTPDEPAV
jgi:Organic radical activating enzymes